MTTGNSPVTSTERPRTFDALLSEQMYLGHASMLGLRKHFAQPRLHDPEWVDIANRFAECIAMLYTIALDMNVPDGYKKAHDCWLQAIRAWHEGLDTAFKAASEDPAGLTWRSRRAWKKAEKLITRGGEAHAAAQREVTAIRLRRIVLREVISRGSRRTAA